MNTCAIIKNKWYKYMRFFAKETVFQIISDFILFLGIHKQSGKNTVL